MNEEASVLVKGGKSSLDFRFCLAQCFTTSDEIPESAVAYDEKFVRTLYSKTALRIQDPIHYGAWCGRKNYLSYQDIVLAMRD